MKVERQDLARNFPFVFIALLLCVSFFGRRPPLGFAMKFLGAALLVTG